MEENKFEKFYKEVFPFWADLPEAEKNFVCDSSFEINYKKGTQIHDGSECSGVFMVQSGCLRIYINKSAEKFFRLRVTVFIHLSGFFRVLKRRSKVVPLRRPAIFI